LVKFGIAFLTFLDYYKYINIRKGQIGGDDMATSDLIARFIYDAIENSDGFAELQRSVLAEMFSCVPSQINYVISTRFSPEHGYIVESRRGGGGYIRITRVQQSPEDIVMNTVNSIGKTLNLQIAKALVSNLLTADIIDIKTANLMMTAISDRALSPIVPTDRGVVRASILKQMLVILSA